MGFDDRAGDRQPKARGTVAAPVFSSVTGAALRLLGVPTDAPVDNIVLPPPGVDVREET